MYLKIWIFYFTDTLLFSILSQLTKHLSLLLREISRVFKTPFQCLTTCTKSRLIEGVSGSQEWLSWKVMCCLVRIEKKSEAKGHEHEESSAKLILRGFHEGAIHKLNTILFTSSNFNFVKWNSCGFESPVAIFSAGSLLSTVTFWYFCERLTSLWISIARIALNAARFCALFTFF